MAEQQQSEEGDISNLTESFSYYKTHPVNLNRAGKEELLQLQLLNEIQINYLLEHIEKNGFLISIYELQSVQGFDPETIRKILPFVYVSDHFDAAHFSFREMLRGGTHECISRLQRVTEHEAGYFKPDSVTQIKKPNSFYLGDPNRFFLRYRFTFNQNISMVINGEKDPGEAFFRGTQKQGFDFYSGHLAIRNTRFAKCIVIGDYQATFGQGLILWNGFAFGKSASPLTVKRNAMGIRPYSSFDENRFFRGAAATFRIRNMELSLLFSYKKIDAHASMTDTAANGTVSVQSVSSLITGGLHNTTGTIADKGTVSQSLGGINLAYNRRNLHIGSTAQAMYLSAALLKTPQLYNLYDFRGKQNINAGIDYSYVFRNMNFFGEGAFSQNGGKAFIQGLIMAPDPLLTLTVHCRYFDKTYQNLFSNAIAENTFAQNETGLYLGAEARLPGHFTLSGYLDQFTFRWLKSGVSAPSHGTDVFAQLNYTPSKKTDLYVRYRRREHDSNTDTDNAYVYLQPGTQENWRFNLSCQVSEQVKLKSRIEYTQLGSSKNNTGIALIQDLVYKKPDWPWSFVIRYALFDTHDYSSRIYAYENDVLYSYSVPALYNKGQHVMGMLNWNIGKKLELWCRLARTIYDNVQVISPGSLNQIDGNHKTEVKIQLKLKL